MKFLSVFCLLSIQLILVLAAKKNVTSSIVPGQFFDRVVIFIFENNDYAKVVKNKYFKSLPKKHNGVLLTNYLATTHPSQPNYVMKTHTHTGGV
jgi:hypothetical protein